MHAQNDRSSTQVLELLEMPLDTLFEISQYLDPTDILNLGRTSRLTRQLVRGSEFKPVWVRARSQYPDLPDCPEDMNEPAYVELMFGDSCLVCGEICGLHTQRRIFSARERLCVKCFESRYTHFRDSEFHTSGIPDRVAKYLPQYHQFRRAGCRLWDDKYYSNVHLASWVQQYSNCETAEDKQAWEDATISSQTGPREHAQRCLQWSNKRMEEILQGRKQVLFGYMKELGYEEELGRSRSNMQRQERHFRQMCQMPLTDKMLEGFRCEIERLMQLVKSERLERELREAYRDRLRTLKDAYNEALLFYPPDQPYLRMADTLTIPRIRSAICDTPLETIVTKSHLNLSSETLAEMTMEATSIIHGKLISLAKAGLADKTFDSTSILALATTVFISRGYNLTRNFFFVPEAISIPASGAPHGPGILEKHAILYDLALYQLRGCPWNIDDRITFDRRTHDVLCDILAVCGLDPTTALLSQLEDQSPIVECLECSTSGSGRLLMSWSWAAHHISQIHPTSGLILSHILSHVVGHKAAEARAAFKKTLLEYYISENQPLAVRTICVHCKGTKNTLQEMSQHLETNHAIPAISHTDIRYAYSPEVHCVATRFMQEHRLLPTAVDIIHDDVHT